MSRKVWKLITITLVGVRFCYYISKVAEGETCKKVLFSLSLYVKTIDLNATLFSAKLGQTNKMENGEEQKQWH